MTYGKTIYMIACLVSLETREINYLFNTNNKYHKGEVTPRHIPVKIHLSTVFSCMFSGFREIFKTPGKTISSTDIFTNLAGKISFNPKDF